MTQFKLEIEYLYKKETSWLYFFTECEKESTAISRATKHYNQLITNSGWTKDASLVSIHSMKKANELLKTITVTPVDLPPARSRRGSNRPDTTDAATTDRGTLPIATDTEQPKANRKNATATKRKTTSAVKTKRAPAAPRNRTRSSSE